MNKTQAIKTLKILSKLLTSGAVTADNNLTKEIKVKISELMKLI
jgi:hypothetical protein